MNHVSKLQASDRERWGRLWSEYLEFYDTSLPNQVYENTWSRIMAESSDLRAFGALSSDGDARLVGIAHFLYYESAWTMHEVCYLQDLYVDPAHRGRGFGRRLIEAVAEAARLRSCDKLYWLTHESNAAARSLYDAVAHYSGFVRYDLALA